MSDSRTAALFDVDGTLVDTSYHHTLAWSRSFARCGLNPPSWRIHRAIGMGGDHQISAVAGQAVEDQFGDLLRSGWAEEYQPFLDEIRPFDGARTLLEQVKGRGHAIVLASSAPKDHLDRYIELLDAGGLTDEVTSADDAEHTKPHPDIVSVALRKAGGGPAVMIGDSPWDAVAARKVGLDTIAVRTGGFSVEELKDAGAIAVYGSPTDLADDLGNTPLA